MFSKSGIIEMKEQMSSNSPQKSQELQPESERRAPGASGASRTSGASGASVTPKNFNYCFNKILLSNKCLFKDF
jgi:hypothetical protein